MVPKQYLEAFEQCNVKTGRVHEDVALWASDEIRCGTIGTLRVVAAVKQGACTFDLHWEALHSSLHLVSLLVLQMY